MMCAINNSWIKAGALSAALAIALGAFGAHSLRDRMLALDEQALASQTAEQSPRRSLVEIFNTAADYQRTHALAIVATGILMTMRQRKSLTVAAWCFLLGTLLFSGSLYALALSGIRWLGAITPIGGVLFIAGWIALVEGACPGKTQCQKQTGSV